MEKNKDKIVDKVKILILGAGPAGSSCAIQLCSAGFDVTIVDIADFPRFRPGESCHPGIEPLLRHLNIWDDIMQLDPLRYRSTYVNNNGETTERFFNKEENWEGLQLPRDKFDLLLLNKAKASGAVFHANTITSHIKIKGERVVSVETNKGTFEFDFLIDATGSKAISSIKLGIKKIKYSHPVISYYSQLSTQNILPEKLNAYFEVSDDYWGYISLIGYNTYSITYSSQQLPNSSAAEFIQRHFGEDHTLILARGYETSWSVIEKHDFTNLYVVGDAFMTFDPTSSKGILKSIMTGVYTSFILENILRNKLTICQGAELYQQWGHDFIEKELEGIKEYMPRSIVDRVFL